METIKPMLCAQYNQEMDIFPCYAQPKLDGIRCIAKLSGSKVLIYSRNGNPLHLPHLSRELFGLFGELPATEFFDGELYVHGKSFQEVQSLVKRAGHRLQESISYCIYDRKTKNPELSFVSRFCASGIAGKHIRKVETRFVKDQDEADQAHAYFVASGYEGTVYRVADCLYKEGKRSPDLLKRKDWQEDDFQVVNVTEGEGKNAGTAVFQCVSVANGKRFDVLSPGSYAEKKAYWGKRNQILGKLLSVKYQNLTDGGIPRFPVALGFKKDR